MNSAVIQKYFPALSAIQMDQFDRMETLYKEWNAQINLVSRKDIDEIYVRHVLHSLAIAKLIQFKPGTKVLDVGTGGGFPGIPLAVMFPDAQFTLVDSIGKKIKVVNAVAASLGLTNVVGIHDRVENIVENFDFVVSRAVTQMQPFYGWVKGKFKKENKNDLKNGILYLKGGDVKAEMTETKLRYKVYDLPQYFDEAYFETKKIVYIQKQ